VRTLCTIREQVGKIHEENDFVRWDRQHIWIAVVVWDVFPFRYQWLRQQVAS
jgi:hypothetical protein